MVKKNGNATEAKLDVMIRLLALQVAPELGVNERARRLRTTGMENDDIAAILGTTNATVRAAGTYRAATSKKSK